jgi:hypothetical protein
MDIANSASFKQSRDFELPGNNVEHKLTRYIAVATEYSEECALQSWLDIKKLQAQVEPDYSACNTLTLGRKKLWKHVAFCK